jgi:hypothetical protein
LNSAAHATTALLCAFVGGGFAVVIPGVVGVVGVVGTSVGVACCGVDGPGSSN